MMTDQPPQPIPADDSPPPDTADTADTGTPVEASSVDANPNHEAAKWRTRYREAEAQNAALAAQLDATRRDQVGAIVTSMGIKPAALWASGAQLGDMLTDAGAIDTAKVRDAVEGARDQLGITKRPASMSGLSSGALAPQPPRDQWREAFTPRRNREPD
jgi:hypothetical protein